MDCPYCGHEATKVLDTRACRGDRVRKRRCHRCGERFSTAERITVEYMKVGKRDGRVEPFSRAKLRKGILRAAAGTGLPTPEVDAFVARVVEIVQPEAADIPVSSREIGELVLEQMHGSASITDVVRIRFAMVFLGRTTHGRGFRGVDDVIAWLRLEYGPPREPVVPLLRKRDGRVEPFQPAKLAAGVALAAAGRGTAAQVDRLARAVASRVAAELSGQAFLTSQQVAAEALKVLREHDPVAYLRYAAAVKGYQSAADVWLDALALRGGG